LTPAATNTYTTQLRILFAIVIFSRRRN